MMIVMGAPKAIGVLRLTQEGRKIEGFVEGSELQEDYVTMLVVKVRERESLGVLKRHSSPNNTRVQE